MDALLKQELQKIESDEFDSEYEGYRIKDLKDADWVLRKLRAIETKEKEDAEIAQMYIDQANNWLEKENAKTATARERFEQYLSDYLHEKRLKDKKFKISTPSGQVSTRKTPEGIAVDDRKVLESLKKQGASEFIRVKEEVNKVDLKKAGKFNEDHTRFFLPDGEVIDGVTYKEPVEKIAIKVEGA